jgi:UDP-GlcNAc:undecaprenyl-phosphate GlcNAc-1-phosphate transferase
MLPLGAFFGVSLALSLILTPAARAVASRYGLVDKPDQRRKLQGQAIPVAGGIAVLLASLLTMAIMLGADGCPWADDFFGQATSWLGLAVAALVIGIVGVLDDIGFLRGRHKLLGQFAAIGILMATGLMVRSIRVGDLELELGMLAIPFTAFFLLGAINSLNLLDGMDGLLGTVALIVTLAFAGMAAMGGKWTTACVSVTMAGALLGFLRYNLPPASVYLGDAGSMLIGLVIGSLAIKGSLKGPATFALAAPVAILAIPILDTLAAIFRRKLTGRSIFTTDRGHLHHCLLRQGFSKGKVLLFVSLFCVATAMGAYLSITLNNEWLALLAAVTVAFLLVGMRWFGHGEARLVLDRVKGLVGSTLRLKSAVGPQDSAVHLQGSGAWTEPWAKMTQSAEELSLKTMHLDINAPALHESYHARWVNPTDDDAEVGETSWSVAIPLVWQDQTVGRLEVSGGRDGEPIWKKVAALTKLADELEYILFKIADEAGLHTRLEAQPLHPAEAQVIDLTSTSFPS